MTPIALEAEDHSRDAAFNQVLHGKSASSKGGFSSMLSKDREAQEEASREYFKHWDNKSAGTETAEIREVNLDPPPKQEAELTKLGGPESRICNSHQTLL